MAWILYNRAENDAEFVFNELTLVRQSMPMIQSSLVVADAQVPTLKQAVKKNGDIFHFWIEYKNLY